MAMPRCPTRCGASGASGWRIVSAGEPHPDVPLGNGCLLSSLGKLELEEYARLLRRSAVGVGLVAHRVVADEEHLLGLRKVVPVALGGGNLHETALALEKADVALRVLSKVRNKVVEAYQEVMRMGV